MEGKGMEEKGMGWEGMEVKGVEGVPKRSAINGATPPPQYSLGKEAGESLYPS